MIKTHLGETIDIHGGGRDLIFPHHENEVAQSTCTHDGKTFVRYWMHNGYINIDGEKMSKSLGNFKLVNDLLDHYAGETLRFALLSAHYRSELTFGTDLLDQAKATLDTFYAALQAVDSVVALAPSDAELAEQPYFQALLDDLNTPIAVRELLAIAKAMPLAEPAQQSVLKGRLLAGAMLLGLLNHEPDEWFKMTLAARSNDLSSEQIEALIEQRKAAKLAKDYALADTIRQGLEAKGVILEDSREGTRWRRQ